MATILSSSSENQNECPYLESLGLRYSPFIPDAESDIYLDERGSQHLNLAIHLLESSQMIVVVLGETGMGKSTLARQLQLRLSDTILPCLINANNLTPQSLLRSMAGRLDIPQDVDVSTQRLLLTEKTISLRHQDCVPLIIIDDAHLLDDETLETLVQLHTGTEHEYNRWELALFSNPGLEQRLASQLATGKENIYEIQLKPYTEAQARDFVETRLKAAGYQGDELPFTDRQFRLLFAQSYGVPANINTAAHNMLGNRTHTPARAQKPETRPVQPASNPVYSALKLQRILVVVAISLLVAILLFQDNINQLFEDETYDAISGSPKSPAGQVTETQTIADNKTTQSTTAPQQTPAKQAPDRQKQKTTPQTTAPASPREDQTDPFETVASSEIPTLSLPQTSSTSDTEAPQQKAAATKVAKPVQAAAPQKPVKAEPAKPLTQAQPASVPAKPPVPADTAIKSGEHSATALSGLDWVMTRNPQHYSLQLIASADEAHIQRYIKRYGLEGRSHYYPILYRNKLLYVLLTGDFADRSSGQQTSAQLPAAIRKDKPWLRALSLIQAEIKRGHK